jgi:predicted RNA binding protein YcfA (HicA-like mRNA interferase family)
MNFPKNVWEQIKNKTADDLITAIKRYGFVPDEVIHTERVYRHPDGRRVSIHYHKGSQTFGSGFMKSMMDDIGWSVKDMRRVEFIK